MEPQVMELWNNTLMNIHSHATKKLIQEWLCHPSVIGLMMNPILTSVPTLIA